MSSSSARPKLEARSIDVEFAIDFKIGPIYHGTLETITDDNTTVRGNFNPVQGRPMKVKIIHDGELIMEGTGKVVDLQEVDKDRRIAELQLLQIDLNAIARLKELFEQRQSAVKAWMEKLRDG